MKIINGYKPMDIMSRAKYENYLKLAEIINWGRKYPTRFMERFFGVELLDYQKYAILQTWITPNSLWCMSRSSGKTTCLAPFVMAKALLVPNWQCYIMAGVGSQSQEAFLKIEKIAKKEIASFTGLTDVFINELAKNKSNTDGFTHNPSSYQFKLYNGSKVNSLNSSIGNNRSKRSNCNIYDEAGFVPEELFVETKPFTTQNSAFKLGGGINAALYPQPFPNQNIYMSSASDVNTHFFYLYKSFAKKMMAGDSDYFVADVSSDMVITATNNGKPVTPPLLTPKTIEDEMARDPEKAMREYKNIFTTDGGDGQIIKMASIIRNSELRVPELANLDNKSKYIIAYDPARNYDQSCIVVGKLIDDPKIGYKVEICNAVSFVDINKAKKTPLRTPEQIDLLKEMIVNYNGKKKADYENIEMILIDAGAGGGGVQIGDYLMPNWKDKSGYEHKGIIDSVEGADYLKKFPEAVDKLKLIQPSKWKTIMFDALKEMIDLDLISFTAQYKGNGVLTFANENKDGQLIESKYLLANDEELALMNIDAAKTQMTNIYRYDSTNNNYRYDLRKDLTGRHYDDLAYCMALIAYALQEKRREYITKKKSPKINWEEYITGKTNTIEKYY